jgi:hypothetical protein
MNLGVQLRIEIRTTELMSTDSYWRVVITVTVQDRIATAE